MILEGCGDKQGRKLALKNDLPGPDGQ